MEFLKRLVRGKKSFPVFIAMLLFEIGISIFYYGRFSDLFQEFWNNAYEKIFVIFEFHQLAAFVVMLAVMLTPFYFYHILEKPIIQAKAGATITNILTIIGNIVVLLVEVYVTKLTFELSAGNIFAQQTSMSAEYAIWGIGAIIAIVNQVGMFMLVQSSIAMKEEQGDV